MCIIMLPELTRIFLEVGVRERVLEAITVCYIHSGQDYLHLLSLSHAPLFCFVTLGDDLKAEVSVV